MIENSGLKKYVAYYRVSTRKQGVSGLGLESQKAIVEKYVGSVGGELINSFTEVESGRKQSRQELSKAVETCLQSKAVLIVAKLDRLARDVEFLYHLRNKNIEILFCDMPQANSLVIGFLAVLAEYEAKLISERTKAALAAKKERGFELGKSDNFTDAGRQLGNKTMQKKSLSDLNNRKAFELIKLLREQSVSYRIIANKLNDAGFCSTKGKKYYPASVRQIEKQFLKAI